MLSILTFLPIVLNIFQINCSYKNLQFIKDSKNDNIINKLILQLITIIMKSAIQLKDIEGISYQCIESLDRTFFIINKSIYYPEEQTLAKYYYNKLLLDSSTNINDLSSFPNCIYSNHDYDFSKTNPKFKPVDPLYITIFIDHRKEQLNFFRNNIQTTSYLLGICFIGGCNNYDIELIVENVMNLLNITRRNETSEIFFLKGNPETPNYLILFLELIPLIIILIHLFIIIFHNFFSFIFKSIKDLCCPKKRPKIIPRFDQTEEVDNFSNNSLKNNTSNKNPNQNLEKYVNVLFNVENNFDFILNPESKDKIHNDNILSYMNGIKGISMITIIFGFVFIDFYNSPIIKKSLDNFYEIMSHPFFSPIYFGIKYAPKLLLCSSGFSLFFKFMCFLDDKIEIEKELKEVNLEELKNKNNIIEHISQSNIFNNINKKENERKNKSTDNIINNRLKNDSLKKEEIKESSSYKKITSTRKKKNRNIPFKYYIWFLTNQVNKYVLYLLIIFFILFSLYDTVVFFIGVGPLWNFFKVKIISTSLKTSSIIPALFSYQGSFLNKFNIDSLFIYLYLVYQEIIFFILSTFIIFIGYKYNLRIDRFILVEISVLFFFRVFYYYLSEDLNVRDYFDLNNYGYFYNSPIFNYLYYSLGIYLGSLNYVIQKGYTYTLCENQKKMYLLGFARLLKILSKSSKLLFHILGILFLILIILFSFGQFFLYEYVKYLNDLNDDDIHKYSDILNSYNKDILTSIIMVFDTDIVVLLVNFMALFFYLKGDSIINDFLNLNFFSIFNKIYFSFILMVNPVILYVFYNTESKINFNMQNCYLYSFACGFLIFIFSVFIYGFFELPYKKVFKLLLKNWEVPVEEKRLDLIEKQVINYKKDEDKDDSELQSDNSVENDEKPFIIDDD